MKKPALWFAALAAVAVLVGCATPSPHGSAAAPASVLPPSTASSTTGPVTVTVLTTDSAAPPTPTTTSPTDPLAAQAAANKKATTAEAQQLLDAVNLPPGWEIATDPPTIWPGMGKPSGSALIDLTKYYQNPMSRTDFMAWEQKHPPAGTTFSGGRSTGRTAPPWTALFWDPIDVAPDSALSEARVGVTSVVSGSGTVVRVDAMTVWEDPRPLPDPVENGEHRLTLTVAGGCPKTDGGATGVTDPHASTTALLPSAAPSAGLICDYYGIEGKPDQLYTSTQLDAVAAQRLAAAVAGIPLSHAPGAVYSCSVFGNAVYFIALSYPDGSTARLFHSSSGCTTLANGRIEVFMPDVSGLHLPPAPPVTS